VRLTFERLFVDSTRTGYQDEAPSSLSHTHRSRRYWSRRIPPSDRTLTWGDDGSRWVPRRGNVYIPTAGLPDHNASIPSCA